MLKPGRCMSVVFGNSSGRIWGLVQRSLRDAGFKASPLHVAMLDKGQRSVKGLNSGSEGVVTVDLIVTMQKPAQGEMTGKPLTLANGDTNTLIRAAIDELSADEACNPSHVHARTLRKAIQKGLVLDELHLGDVLIALRNAGYGVDRKTGLLYRAGAVHRELLGAARAPGAPGAAPHHRGAADAAGGRGGLSPALPGLGAVVAILALVFYVAGVMATQLFGGTFRSGSARWGRACTGCSRS